jgi:hypothetical protein
MATYNGVAVVDMFHVLNEKAKESRDSRRSFTRKQRLAAISYAQNTYITDKNSNPTLISRYKAAGDLGIQISQLKR